MTSSNMLTRREEEKEESRERSPLGIVTTLLFTLLVFMTTLALEQALVSSLVAIEAVGSGNSLVLDGVVLVDGHTHPSNLMHAVVTVLSAVGLAATAIPFLQGAAITLEARFKWYKAENPPDSMEAIRSGSVLLFQTLLVLAAGTWVHDHLLFVFAIFLIFWSDVYWLRKGGDNQAEFSVTLKPDEKLSSAFVGTSVHNRWLALNKMTRNVCLIALVFAFFGKFCLYNDDGHSIPHILEQIGAGFVGVALIARTWSDYRTNRNFYFNPVGMTLKR